MDDELEALFTENFHPSKIEVECSTEHLFQSEDEDYGCSIEDIINDIDDGSRVDPLLESRVPTVQILYQDSIIYPIIDPRVVRSMILDLTLRLFQSGPFSFLNQTSFNGEGVYALYYQGEVQAYAPLQSLGSTCPIYIGKASQQNTYNSLSMRLREHCDTLQQANLGLENFTFRFVCLPSNLVEFSEYNLIELFKPLWNVYLRGFGERTGNRRSKKRENMIVSKWDTYHPGRPTCDGKVRDLGEIEAKLGKAIVVCRNAYTEAMTLLESHHV